MESENTDLSHWGLPENVINFYKKKGIKRMFPWQYQCLTLGTVLDGGNLVYSAPTSAGKTLVAEILVSQTVFDRKKKALIILPFVSVAREKMFYFQDMLSSNGIKVEGYMGGHSPGINFEQVQVAICTIEKANSFINRMMEEKTLSKLGIVVVDELHLLADSYRGYLLELLLTKLKYMSLIDESHHVQIVGMSALLPNLNVIAKWLKADIFYTDFRPIPLHEKLKCGLSLFNKNMEKVGEIDGSLGMDDAENVGRLCLDTIQNGHSVLIFCPTKIWCENLAGKLANLFRTLGCSAEAETEGSFGWIVRKQLDLIKLQEVVDHLRASPVGLDPELLRSVTFGVAFHHAGLTLDERDIIEGSFRSGAIRVLCATSTLSSGVNLPAKRVIIRSPMSFGGVMDILTYRQMIGRAGRMGVDTEGESILICKQSEKELCRGLMCDFLKPIESCLGSGKLSASLKRALLEIIVSGVASSKEEISKYVSCTFLSSSKSQHLVDPLTSCVQFLEDNELIRFLDSEKKYLATPLGQACLASSLPPDEGLALFRELERARRCFVLDSDLHIIYQVIPYSVSEQWTNIDWLKVLNILEELSPSMRRVAELVGVEDAFLVKVVRGTANANSNDYKAKLSIHRRFYTALALQDLVNEVPLPEVAQKFDCNKGLLQSLQQSAATYAGMVSEFAKRLRWSTVDLIVSQFQERLQFGVHRELCELMKITSLNGVRARALFNAGFKSIACVAKAELSSIETALLTSLPFQSKNQQAGETEYEHDERTRANTVWVTGRAGLSVRNAAEKIIQEARALVEIELGPGSVSWDKKEDLQDLYNASTIVMTPVRLNNSTPKRSESPANRSECSDIIEDTPDVRNCLRIRLQKKLHESLKNESDDGSSSLWESFKVPDIPDFDNSNAEISGCENNQPQLADTILVDGQSQEDEIIRDANTTGFFSPNLNIPDLPREKLGFSPDLFRTPCPKNPERIREKSPPQPLSSGIFSDASPVLLDTPPCHLETVTESFFCTKRKASPDFIPPSDNDEDSPDDGHLTKRMKISKKLVSPKRLNSESPRRKRNDLMSPKRFKSESPGRRKLESPKSSNSVITLVTLDESGSDEERIRRPAPLSQSIIDDVKNAVGDIKDLTWDTMHIVDVCGDRDIFESFWGEINRQRIVGIALGCTKKLSTRLSIGAKFKKSKSDSDLSLPFSYGDLVLDGIAFCWQTNQAYYLSLGATPGLPTSLKITSLKEFFERDRILRIFDSKEQLKVFFHCVGFLIESTVEDPKVASWLLSKSNKELGLVGQLMEHFPEIVPLSQLMGTLTGIGSPGLNIESTVSPKTRSCCEAILTYHLLREQVKVLRKNQLYKTFCEIEMPVITILVEMELTGFQFNDIDLQNAKNSVDSLIYSLEEEAYKLAGHKFALSSYNNVGKVLYTELQLKSVESKRKRRTSKEILVSLSTESKHPLPNIILQWRKLKAISSKVLAPLLQLLPANKIYGCYETFSATGRLAMKEPNMQTFPKDFSVIINDEIVDTISLRNLFVASDTYCLISADYCQLELRILAHLSNDRVLIDDICKSNDVFVQIASSINKVTEEKVTDDMRQRTKQICYGIIYGIGIRSLATQLNTDEEAAMKLMDDFKLRYQGVSQFLAETLKSCRENGFVQTIAQRRRYFPSISHSNSTIRGEAERQAFNTVVQGSAADIAKKAMIEMRRRCRKDYKQLGEVRMVLHLHDELLYEVKSDKYQKVASVLRDVMEHAWILSVPLPVKIKFGSSWGNRTVL